MAAFLDDRPLVAGVNEDWDDINTIYICVEHISTGETPRHGHFANSDENNVSLA